MFSPLFLFAAEMKIKHSVWALGKHFAMELQSYLKNTSYEETSTKVVLISLMQSFISF